MNESDNQLEIERRVDDALALFHRGAACSQSVLTVFADDCGWTFSEAMSLASGFGAGVGRLREVCGAVSAMVMVAGVLYGNDNPDSKEGKDATYQMIQDLLGRFSKIHGTLICRELLNLKPGQTDVPVSEARTKDYYNRRPCETIVADAVRIMCEFMLEHGTALTGK